MNILRSYGSDLMMVLITYDVETVSPKGRGRLRRVAKKCTDYGMRVQNSVFECIVDAAQCKMLQAELLSIIDLEKDSLRFYYLGNNYQTKIEHFGVNEVTSMDDVLLI